MKSCRVRQITRLTAALLVGALASLLGTHPARASTLNISAGAISNLRTLNITTTTTCQDAQNCLPIQSINGNVYAGSIVPSSLDGTPLPFMYCVDVLRDIYVPGIYSTEVRTDAQIHGKTVGDSVGNSLVTASRVAWLLDHAYSASSPLSLNASAGLQAAIWEVIYGTQFTLNSAQEGEVITQYNSYITALNTAVAAGTATASVSNYAWLSPTSANCVPGNTCQGQVTRVPEPSSTLLLTLALSGVFGICWWRKR